MLVIETDLLKKHVTALVSIQPPRNYANQISLKKTGDYLFREFEKLTDQVQEQTYEVEGHYYRNIIASYGNQPKKRVVVGAHYDVFGTSPGADDNASAVAGMLELARILFKYKPTLDFQVDFAGYTLEEPPFFASECMGSAVHAKSLQDQHVDVKLMICLEMIGYFTEKSGTQKYPFPEMKATMPGQGDYIALVTLNRYENLADQMRMAMKKKMTLEVQKIVLPVSITGVDFSDHRNFWQRGYPAVMVTDTAFYRNPHYHKDSDTIETLNFDKMAEVVQGVYQAIIDMASD
ncbi:M28 family peptidase [bacterium]|nr:M28 family peptidase [bacterium]